MKRKNTLLLIFLFSFDCAFAQITFHEAFGALGGDYGKSVCQANDGGYLIAGYTVSLPPYNYDDVYLVKVDSNGNLLWTKTFGGTGTDVAYSVKQLEDGSLIIVGYTASFGAGNNDVYLIKVDANGNLLWSKTYGGIYNDQGFDVQKTNDGGYIITGETDLYGIGNNDVYLVKTDSAGNLLWSKTYGEGWNDFGNSVQETNDDGYIITGWKGGKLYLIKTDPIGNLLWSKTFTTEHLAQAEIPYTKRMIMGTLFPEAQ